MKQWSEMIYKKTNMLVVFSFTSYKKLFFACVSFFA